MGGGGHADVTLDTIIGISFFVLFSKFYDSVLSVA